MRYNHHYKTKLANTNTLKVLDVATESIEIDVALIDNNIKAVSPLSIRRAQTDFNDNGSVFLGCSIDIT